MNDAIRMFLLVFFLAIMLYIAIRLGLGHYSRKRDWKLNFDKFNLKDIFKWKKETKTEYIGQVQPEEKKAEPTKEEEETKAKLDTYQEL